MKRVRFLVPLAGLALFACQDQTPLTAPPGSRPVADIVDGHSASGNQHFFFLAPIRPLTLQPPKTAPFNPDLSPVVNICEVGSTTCFPPLAMAPGSPSLDDFPRSVFDKVFVIPRYEAYAALWNTFGKVGAGKVYRIRVLVGQSELGFADAKVVTTKQELLAVDRTKFVPLLKDLPLLIAFRIEQTALCSGALDCAEATVGAAAQDVVTPSQRAAIHFDAGSFSQNVELVIKKVVTDGKTTCHATDLQQFDDCYDIKVTPNIPLTAGHLARVEICLALVSTNPDAVAQDPLLVKSEPGVPGVVELAEAGHTLITCPGYPNVGPSPIGAKAPRGLWRVARAGWRFVRGLLEPEPLHAATAASLVIDEGLGGLTGGFSRFGWVIPKAFSISAGNAQSAPAGQVLPINPKVCLATTHPESRGVSGETATFTITGGGGKFILGGETEVDLAQVTTDEAGCAEVQWRLGTTGPFPAANSARASVPFATQRVQNLTAMGLAVGISGASLSPTLDIGGLEGTATVGVRNGTGEPVSGLVVEGWIRQGSVRQAAGNSGDPFMCSTVTCTQSFNFVASSSPAGLVCGPATAQFELKQSGTLLHTFALPVTLTSRGPCP